MEKIKLADLEFDYKDALKALTKLAEQIRATKAEISGLEKENEILRNAGRADTEQYKNNAKAVETNKVALAGLQKEYRDTQTVVTSSIAAKDEEIGTIRKLEARNKELRTSLRNLNLETEAGRKQQKTYIAEINKNTETIRTNSDAYVQQKMNIGNYKSALDVLPGSMKNVANGFQMARNAAKAFIANPVVLAITAIVAAVAGLVKAFKSTDEGATKMAATMKAVGNVLEVITDRAVSFTKLLKDLVTLNWKDLKKDGQETFGGIGDAIKDAAKAGWDFAYAMDTIKDGMAADLIVQAQMRQEIEKLKADMVDQTKTFQERQEAARKAKEMELELNRKQLQWSEMTTDAELKNLAAKLQNSKLTQEQKEEQVKEWVRLDAEQLESQRKTNAALADFYNKNEEGFQKVQAMIAEDINKQTEYFSKTKELNGQLSGFIKQIAGERTKAAEEREKQLAAENEIIRTYYEQQALMAEAEMLREVELEKQKIAEKERLRLEAIEKEKQWDEELAAFRQEKAFIDADNERIIREVAMNDRFQAELDALAREQEAEIQAALKTGASVSLITKKYAEIEKVIEREKQKAKLDIVGSFAGSLAQLFSEETRLGKAAAITQTVINTYKGAMAAFAETPGGVVIKSIAAATAVTTGLAAIKNIVKAGGGGGGASIGDLPGSGGSGTEVGVSPNSNAVTAASAAQPVLVLEEFQFVQGTQVKVKSAGEL